jgi:plastocyanin
VSSLQRLLLPAVAAAALAAAGCGSDDGGSGAPVAQTDVGMQDNRFDPEGVRVTAGQEITWTNDESVPHDVVATSGADFESDPFGKGKSFRFTPTKAGTIRYECTLHPGMDGRIEVAAAK